MICFSQWMRVRGLYSDNTPQTGVWLSSWLYPDYSYPQENHFTPSDKVMRVHIDKHNVMSRAGGMFHQVERHIFERGGGMFYQVERHVSSRVGGTFHQVERCVFVESRKHVLSSGEACLFERRRRVAREVWHSLIRPLATRGQRGRRAYCNVRMTDLSIAILR